MSSNVVDIPRKAGETDLLGVDTYAEALVEFIASALTPTTIAIQGEWGSGKTSLMNQVRHQLCEKHKKDSGEGEEEGKYYGVWINTWQSSMMRSPAEAVINIIRLMTEEVLEIMRRSNYNGMKEVVKKMNVLFRALAKAGTKTFVASAGLNSSAVDELFVSEGQNGPVAFTEALHEAIAQCLNSSKKKGFIFFIDDLDRIDPPVAVEILELLKNLFEVEKCIFILAVDYEVVVKGLARRFGTMTEKNEREFRSFFDKIIQVPFSMPVSTYNINSYLNDALLEIGYFTKGELRKKVSVLLKDDNKEQDKPDEGEKAGNPADEDSRVSACVSEMARNSTGTNPRSLKRLINSLSLIRIMHKIHKENQQDNPGSALPGEMTTLDKLINFGLVCIQVSYPSIYELLIREPNYKNWGNEVAHRMRLPRLDETTQKSLEEDFGEKWEQVLYRACMNNPYLLSRVYAIDGLLEQIADLIGNPENFGEEISRILSFGSVTAVTGNQGIARERRKPMRDIGEYLAKLSEKGFPQHIQSMVQAIILRLKEIYGERIRTDLVAQGDVYVHVCNNKSYGSKLVHIKPQKKSVVVFGGPGNRYSITSMEELKEDFYNKTIVRFKELSDDDTPALVLNGT